MYNFITTIITNLLGNYSEYSYQIVNNYIIINYGSLLTIAALGITAILFMMLFYKILTIPVKAVERIVIKDKKDIRK